MDGTDARYIKENEVPSLSTYNFLIVFDIASCVHTYNPSPFKQRITM